MSDDAVVAFIGSAFSLGCDGKSRIAIGSDSPLNQSASFPALSSCLFCVDLSPVNLGADSRFDRVGDDWRDCSGES